jgi:two-component system sensor histidine kinase RpfC
MHASKPYLHLRIGGYAVATTGLCLLILFLYAAPIDPLIQAGALLCYLAAVYCSAVVLRRLIFDRSKATTNPQATDTHDAAEQAEDRSSDETISAASAALSETAPPPDAQTAYMLLSPRLQTAHTLEACFAGWGRELTCVSSCAEASQRLLNLLQASTNLREVALLVDTGELEIDPIHLPALTKQDASPVKLRLIGLLDQQQSQRIALLQDAGYDAFLTKPLVKSQLFSTINSTHSASDGNPKIVDLASYRKNSKRQNRKRILVADKNTAERKRLATTLQASGHRVKTVDNGEQALDALERQRYDIALINLDLPIMSAVQVIKLHRFTTPHSQWISFIVMTDQTTPTTLRTCRDLQVRACLFKPVPTETLIRIIEAAPVISLPTPAAHEQLPDTLPPGGLETQFLHADLLDTRILKGLEHLDNDHDFVPDLIAIFDRDSTAILQRMEESMEYQDTKHFVELSNVLMDNAGQLGAFALYEACLGLQRMNDDELNATLPSKLERLRDLVDRTSQAFKRYLRERSDQQSDQN